MRRPGPWLLVVVLAAALAGCGGSPAEHVRLSVSPRSTVVDEPVAIRLSGLRPHQQVTLLATLTDANGTDWTSSALFAADGSGDVDVARSPALSGTYRGSDAMGLFWSMHAEGEADSPSLSNTFTVYLSAVVSGRTVATATVQRRFEPPGVRLERETLGKQGFTGCFWEPRRAARPAPAVLVLGGSEGGLDCGLGLLAGHGYPELHVAYFGLPGLPSSLEQIPLEYFAGALRWLARQPGVDPHRLVLMGASRGAEAAILTAAAYPSLVHGAVEEVGSSVTMISLGPKVGAWTLHGRPFANGTVLPVWKVNGPLLLLGAGDDPLTGSGYAAQDMAATLRAHGKRDFTVRVYPKAGHGMASGIPYFPLGVPTGTGGTFAGDAQARDDAWLQLLAFLGRLKR